MQKITVDRLLQIANILIDSYDGASIEYDIEVDHPEEIGSPDKTFSVEFTKNGSSLCRLFDDHELYVDNGVVLLVGDSGKVYEVIPNFSIDIGQLITSKKSAEDINEFLNFFILQTALFVEGDNDASNDE